MANLGITLEEQKAQIEALLDLLALAEFQSQGIQLNEDNYNSSEIPVKDISGNYPDESYVFGIPISASHLPNQFHFEEAAIGKGLSLPLTGNLTFNWYANNALLGSYSTAEYDYFCLPMVRKFRNQRSDFVYDWNFDGSMAGGFYVSLLAWLSDTTFLGHGGYWQQSSADLNSLEGSVEFALDGSHKTISKYGKLFQPDLVNDTVLMRQMGFLSTETLSTFRSQANWEFDWMQEYKVSLEGSFTNLLSVGVFHFDFYKKHKIASIQGSSSLPDIITTQNWGNTIAASSAVVDHASLRLVELSNEDGKVRWDNASFGSPDPTIAINLRDDASIEVHIKDKKETTTSGMPRIFFWGANSAALPANASTVPVNGWCVKWDTSYAQYEVFKDGVSQGTGALPALSNGDFEFWLNIIAVGANNYEFYFNDILILTVARTYSYTYGTVGMYAYNNDGGASTAATCRLIEVEMSTIGRMAGDIRNLHYDSTNSLLYWVDKHGVVIRYDISTNGYTKYLPTGANKEMWWGVSDNLLWVLYSDDKIIEGLNLTTLAVDFSDDRSAEAGFAGYACTIDKNNSVLVAYEKDSIFDGYDTIEDVSLFTRTTVVADFTQVKTIIDEVNKSNPHKQDEAGYLRGGRYWHSQILLFNKWQQVREIQWSPNGKSIVLLGYHEVASNIERDEFCLVVANEPSGFTQTGRVWSLSPIPSRNTPAIELMGEYTLNLAASILGMNIYGVPDEGYITDQKFIAFDANAIYRFIFTGAFPTAGAHDFSDFVYPEIHVQGQAAIETYQADATLNHYNGTGLTGIGIWEAWFYNGWCFFFDFSSRTDGITYFNMGAGNPKWTTGSNVSWGINSNGVEQGSKMELWRYPIRGYNDDNYHMG